MDSIKFAVTRHQQLIHIMPASTLSHQRGVILVLSLVILMAMTLIGITAMQNTSQEERMAQNVQQQNLAFQAAEYGLRAGEQVLEAKLKALAATNSPDTNTPGWTQPDDVDNRTYWTNYAWENAPKADIDKKINNLVDEPRYVIEKIDFTVASASTGSGQTRNGSVKFQTKRNTSALAQVTNYRVTSRGVGGVKDAVVILQTTFSY